MFQGLVAAFHKKYGHPAPAKPTREQYRYKLRVGLVVEEALEFAQACGFDIQAYADNGKITINMFDSGPPNWPEMIDALCDLLYVTFGSFVEAGLDAFPFYSEVHRSNMTKTGGQNSNGKTTKGAGFQLPEIEQMLEDIGFDTGSAPREPPRAA